jgi:hypothetical protein
MLKTTICYFSWASYYGSTNYKWGPIETQKNNCVICHDLPFVETRAIYDGFRRL